MNIKNFNYKSFGFTILKIALVVFALALIGDMAGAEGVICAGPSLGIIGGSFREVKFAGIPLTPDPESKAQIKFNTEEYEVKLASDGTKYSTGAEDQAGFVEQDFIFTGETFSEFQKKQDGNFYSGSATLKDGTVLTLDCAINGELMLDDGKATVRLAGDVTKQ